VDLHAKGSGGGMPSDNADLDENGMVQVRDMRAEMGPAMLEEVAATLREQPEERGEMEADAEVAQALASAAAAAVGNRGTGAVLLDDVDDAFWSLALSGGDGHDGGGSGMQSSPSPPTATAVAAAADDDPTFHPVYVLGSVLASAVPPVPVDGGTGTISLIVREDASVSEEGVFRYIPPLIIL